MLFNAFKRPQLDCSNITTRSTWRVARGLIDHREQHIVWHDRQFVVILPPDVAAESWTISPNEQFVLVGDVCLSQPEALWLKLGISAPPPTTDLNLVAHLWEKYGIDTWDLLIGMVNLVVWDRQQQQLCFGRDRVGARSLYYTTHGQTRWIAPQLRSLLPYHSQEIDPIALRDYLCCAFVPGDRTMWQQVREVRPGTVIQPDGTAHAYWQLQEQIVAADQSLEWHGDRLRLLLDQVVQESLPATDQPVGVFLSGGLDSSCITALTAKHHPAPVHTYSIHFGNRTPHELAFSSLVAEHCQTEHHILEITFEAMWQRLPEAMANLDDPIGDPLTVPNLLLGQMAKRDVGVILNGEGGDPCFGGPKNQPMLINSLYGSVTHQDTLQAYLISYQKCATGLAQLLKPAIWESVQSQPWVFSAELESDRSYLNRLMALNIQFKGADQILTKVSNLTQAAGLLGRSPLFDQRVVDLSMSIPPEYKLSGVEEKAVLKQAVADLLPDAIINRPKSGMMVPVQMGFRKYWNREARALLLNPKAAIAPYLSQLLIRDWLDYRGDTWQRYGVKLWLLASLEIWLQVNRR
jgi:asparagine synthase (glutamine-hydrolysing)